jgi:flagellar hook-associated protein 3 FlgL
MIPALSTAIQREIAQQARLASALSTTQTEISTGKRMQRASEDPVAASRIAAIKQSEANNAAWANNVTRGISLNSQADSVLQSVSELITQSKSLLVQASSDTQSATDRSTIATQLTAIASQLGSLETTRDVNGQPLFASAAATTARYGENEVFAAVPSHADTLVVFGTSFSAVVSAAATAVATGHPAQMSQALADLGKAVDQSADGLARLGLAANRLQSIQNRQASANLVLETERSTLEDTDVSAAVTKLNQQSLTLQAAQAAFARINRQTLFDILGQ